MIDSLESQQNMFNNKTCVQGLLNRMLNNNSMATI